ncbi:MAG: hypothetical protein QM698_10850 [Micropepsaceae bacterium]
MKPLVVKPLIILAALAFVFPARAAGDAAKVYGDLIGCYVAFEQDKADSVVRGDPARGAKRDAQIPPVLKLLGQYGLALGKDQAAIEADMKAGMTAWFTGIASGTVDPVSLGGTVAGCEAWLKL